MIIHHIYCDSNAAGGGDGSKTSPFNMLSLITTVSAASGDTRYIHIKSGSHFLGERFPSGIANVVGRDAWIDVYGGSERPIIDASTLASSWSQDPTYGFYTATLGTNVFPDVATRLTIGCLFEDGVPMRMELYDSNHTNLAASLAAGGFACNWVDGKVYMIPSSGVPGSHVYRASTLAYVFSATQTGTSEAPLLKPLEHRGPRFPHTPDGREWNFWIEGLRLIGGKWGGITFERGTARVNDCELYGMGGVQWAAYTIPHSGNSSHLGNAIGGSNDARGILVENCKIEQTFDSGISPQTFNSGDVVTDVIIRNNTITACGFYGIEISTHGTGATVKNVLVEGNHIYRPQDCFSYPIHLNRYRGIAILETGTTNVLDNIVVRNNVVEDLEDNHPVDSGNGGTAYVSTEGTNIDFSRNIASNCQRHGFYLPVGTGQVPSDLVIRRNIIDDCGGAGIFLNGSVTATQVSITENEITNCASGFRDTSSANSPVRLDRNQLDGTDAVDASRTTGITGSGNTSTGVKTGYEYLFA